MKIFQIIKNKKYAATAFFSALAMLITYPLIQTLAVGVNNLDVWIADTKPINLILYVIFSIVFGIFFAIQIFNLKQKTCSIGEKITSATSGSIASLVAILVPQCPACVSLVTLFLPASSALVLGGFFVKYNTLLISTSILLLILGIYLLGGFKRE